VLENVCGRFSGYVDENSGIGTKVLDDNGKEIVFVVTDADKVGKVEN
jgi:predicted polyphosphate/ATP-dependent NAD kinase